jgi:radical SAM superfamily enzyme YgiQ (UPF0313 family)
VLGALFDLLIEQGRTASITYAGISMPQVLAAQDDLLRKARAAGVTMFYLVQGFDPISKGAYTGKDSKNLERAKAAVERCWEYGIEPYAGFLIGNDQDDEGTVDRMLEFAARTGIRKAEFAIFTPYPGTPSFAKLSAEGRIIDRTWKRYNDANVVFQPAQMSPDALTRAYLRLWAEFYADKMHLSELPQLERTIQF